MPDVLTHLLFGAAVALLVRRDDSRPEQMMIVLGSVLIDIERPVTWLIAETSLSWIGLCTGFHSIIGALVLSYFAAVCFCSQSVSLRERFGLILVGCVIHLLLDMTMGVWPERGIYLLYPLGIPFSFNLLWNDFWGYPVLGVLALSIAFTSRCLLHYRQKTVVETDMTEVDT